MSPEQPLSIFADFRQLDRTQKRAGQGAGLGLALTKRLVETQGGTLRGVAKVTAVTIVSEVGALSRFPNPRQLMGYCGLVPSEFSSGKRIQRACITNTGNAHLRRVLIESAWCYQYRPWMSAYLRKRQQHLPDEIQEIAWKAQHRLHARYTTLTAAGKNKGQIITAIGRELLGFIWAIGVKTEVRGQLKTAAA